MSVILVLKLTLIVDLEKILILEKKLGIYILNAYEPCVKTVMFLRCIECEKCI